MMKDFGWFKIVPHGDGTEEFEEYKKYHNKIEKEKVARHMRTLRAGVTSVPSYDVFTGEKLQAGLFEDGEFIFPMEFLHYYENYDIGIPYDYEDYLVNELKL